jgi:membrane protease YdiL (CAAX protease family)
VTSLFVPWDFLLILILLAVFIPWRGVARLRRLTANPAPSSSERMALYGSTILFQWLLVLIVVWRCAERGVDPEELGISTSNPWRLIWTGAALTAILCLNQLGGLRKMSQLPLEKRGSLFAVSQKIMPRTLKETWLFAGLALTAGISEEFLYRGFVFLVFVRMIVNFTAPNLAAALLSSLWFAVAHAYQGRRGVVTTFVVGLIFASTRVWTGSVLPAMLAHAGIDLVAGLCFARMLRTGRPDEHTQAV